MTARTIQKFKRLGEMSRAELAWRLREKLCSESERVRFFLDGSGSSHSRLALGNSYSGQAPASFKEYLQSGPAQRFYLPGDPEERQKLRQFVTLCCPEWTERAIQRAEALCEHRVELLGYGEIDLGREIDWHRDPISRRAWPRRFWADYDLVHDTAAGDPKTIHELNRQQHLPQLAKAYFLTGEEKYAAEAVAQLQSWMDQNPPGCGVNWHSSLEIALRLLSWLWTIFFLAPARSFEEDAARGVTNSLFAQLDHIHRYPSLFSSPNTHLLGEAAALFVGGVLFPECKRASAWRDLGASLLETEMENQVFSDGVHGELSSYYHCYALDFSLQALVLADRNGFSFPPRIWNRLASMMDFLMHVSRPDGTIPLLGDDDGGRALALDQTTYRSFRDALCTGAILFHRPDFKHQAGRFHEETLWLLGEQAWSSYDLLPGSAPQQLSAAYTAAGYFIQRSDWTREASHLVFDCGGMGILRGGHGHADCLSLALSAGGQELLVDPGTSVYNGAPEWRNFFRSSKAHNTVVVDGLDQSESGGTFHWNRTAQSRLAKHLVLDGIEYVEGEHNGYSRLPQGVIHRRRLLCCKSHYWAVVDDFRGEGEHTFHLYYHFHPDAKLIFGGSPALASRLQVTAKLPGAELLLSCCASVPVEAELVGGQDIPVQGWASSRYGNKRPAPVLRVSFRSGVPCAIVSFLVPFTAESHTRKPRQERAPLSVLALASNAHLIACSVEQGRRRDLLVVPLHHSEQEVAQCRLRGGLFYLHTENGALKKLFAVDARSLQYAGRTIFENGEPLDHVWEQFEQNGSSSSKEDRTGLIQQNEVGETDYVRDLWDCELRSR